MNKNSNSYLSGSTITQQNASEWASVDKDKPNLESSLVYQTCEALWSHPEEERQVKVCSWLWLNRNPSHQPQNLWTAGNNTLSLCFTNALTLLNISCCSFTVPDRSESQSQRGIWNQTEIHTTYWKVQLLFQTARHQS